MFTVSESVEVELQSDRYRPFTYEDLLADLQMMSHEQRRQPVQVMMSSQILDDEDGVKPLMPVLCCGTVEHFCAIADNPDNVEGDKTRGSQDNKHNPEAVVLLADLNYFAPD